MAPVFLVLALVIQCSFIHAETDVSEDQVELKDNVIKPDLENEAVKDFTTSHKEWLDMFTSSNGNIFPGPSAAMMAEVTNCNKTAEEQLEDIKEMALQISRAIEAEMVSLFSLAMTNCETNIDENGIRKKRSTETPLDSTQMVMKLLNHIKSNNEYQNIAIEKMMTAQEIAEKFGIEFNPDPEILSDLAMAANDHAQEMTNMLKNACELKNITGEKIQFIPVVDEPQKENDTYYVYGVHHEDEDMPSFEYMPDIMSKAPEHTYYSEPFPYYNNPYESQISSPPVHHHSAPVTPKPSFYDPFMYPFTPVPDFYSPYCSVEPIMPGLLIPIEDPEPEPELIGEEVEETITTRMLVEKGDEPGSTVVNHVTSYTISEKSHFKPPQIEKLPQHFQYCFFLI